MPYRSGGDEQHLAPGSTVVDDLVRQFADPYAFLRELVQNSIDAGARSIRVHMDRDARGGAAWSVTDDGAGMTLELIEGPLLTAFASSKEGDDRSIGKYGVGFLSVFGMAPTLVRVVTHRAEGAHEVRLFPDHAFEVEELPPRSGHGTLVVVEHPIPAGGDAAHEDRGEAALLRWCRHAEVPIELDRPTRSGRRTVRVDRPFALSAAVIAEAKVDGLWALVGVTAGTDRLGAAPDDDAGTGDFAGLYNRGLTLIASTAGDHVIPGLRFKLMGAALRHTLSRDDVKRDREHARAMDLVRRTAAGPLRDAIDAHLLASAEEASRSGVFAAHDALLAAGHARLPTARVRLPLVTGTEGTSATVDVERLSSAGGVLASRGATPAARELAGRGATIVRLPDDERAAAAMARDVAIMTGASISFVHDEARRLIPRGSAELGAACEDLGAALEEVLRGLGRSPAAVCFASVEGAPVATPSFFLERGVTLPRVVLPEELADTAARPWKGRMLVLSAEHPLVAHAVRLADEDARFAATWLARAVLLAHDETATAAEADALLHHAAGIGG